MMPPTRALSQIPPAVLAQQKQGTAFMIWTIGAFCIFGWEWLLCLPKEYKRIWKKPMNASSVLYIVNRYFGLLQFSFVVSRFADVWSPKAYKHVYLWEPVGALISTVLSQMILGSRVYAVFSQNKVVAFILGTTLIVEVVIGGISISTTMPPSSYTGSVAAIGPPCGAVMGPFGWLISFWTIPLFYGTTTFILTAWKAYGYWKEGIYTPFFTLIWRDGLLYFFVIFSMNTANVMILLTVPPSLKAVNSTPTLVLEVVLSCRLLLNLRSAAKNSVSKLTPILSWSESSNDNPLSSVLVGDRFRSTEVASTQGRGMKLEPTRLQPINNRVASIQWDAQTLYTNWRM